MDSISLTIVALFVVLFTIWLSRKSIRNTLPGPMGLPIVGYIPFMTSKPYVKLTQLARKYGPLTNTFSHLKNRLEDLKQDLKWLRILHPYTTPVYSLPLGSKRVVVLADFQAIKEAFSSDDFSGRPPDLPFELSEETIRTKVFIGKPWKEQRRFSLHTFRDLGFGKTKMEEHIKEEILELVDRMSAYAGKTVRMSDLLSSSMSNNIASLLFGRRMNYDDPRRKRLDTLLSEVGRLAGALGWQIFFPWARATMNLFGIGNQARLGKALLEAKAFIRSEIKEHEETLDSNNIRDFVDAYLLEIEKRAENPDSTFKREVLVDLSRAFFGAGSETVRITVDWMLLLCAAFPDVQRRIHLEIDEVLGRDRFPTAQDRPGMPYTEAALCEMMRWKSIVPLNVMRYTLEDTELNGYFIPNNTDVLAVLWAVDHDEKLWGEDVFDYKPERFLSADGQKVVKPEYFIPFSIGKRSCPGKVLAEIEVFLYLTSILQRFEVRIPDGKQADLEGVLGISLQPKRQELCLNIRQ